MMNNSIDSNRLEIALDNNYGDNLNEVLQQMSNTIETLQLRVAELEARV
jgi:hypothetical protein